MQYNLFTVSVTNGSAIVTGALGTKFLSKAKPGNSFKVKGDPVMYQIASIQSDTQLTLSAPFSGATAYNVQYQVTTDYTPNFGFAEINVGDQDWPVHLTLETIRKIDEVLGYSVGEGITFKGTWNAATNAPVLPQATSETIGWAYKVAATGATVIDGTDYWVAGDTVISNGSRWVRVPHPETSASDSAKESAISAAESAASASESAISASEAGAFLSAMAAATTVTTQNFGDSGTVGVELPYARQDHKHAMPPLPIDITTKTGILKGNGAGISPAIAGTDYVSPTGSAAQLTNFPVLNQDTTGNAATATKLETARTINGVSFDGTANVTINAVDATARVAATEKGAANGVATLDATGKVPAVQLPAYVDDVLEFASSLVFPATGEAGKVYLAADTNVTYRWSGSSYVVIGSDLALGETASSAYRGDRGKISYDHSQVAHAPADAEKNVQADWAESATSADAYIKNKPTLGTAAATNASDYVAATSTPRITTSSVAPSTPVLNELWIDDNEAGLGYTVGTTAGTVAAGDDTRIVGAYTHAGLTEGAHGVSGAIVGTNDAQTLTNKTLVSPVISSVVNTGTLTLPTSTDTLVGRTTADTLTNKTISGSNNTITNVSLSSGVTGTLPVANGGTGATTFTANYLLKGNGTNAVTASSVYVNDSGNVGIGTTNPVSPGWPNLLISGSSAAGLYFEDTGYESTGDGIGYFTYNNGILAYSTASRGGAGTTGTTERYRVTATGNLLVGTTTDDGVNKLQVNGSISSNGLTVVGSVSTPRIIGYNILTLTVQNTWYDIYIDAAALFYIRDWTRGGSAFFALDTAPTTTVTSVFNNFDGLEVVWNTYRWQIRCTTTGNITCRYKSMSNY